MATRCYDLFISHAWDYDERYQGIVRLLNSVPGFTWRDYSVPRDRPIVDPRTEVGVRLLTSKLDEQIRQATCFILVAGMFVNHREWVQREIRIAQKYGKRVVGVRRRGQQITPGEVVNVSHALVNWNSQSLVDAIRSVA